MSRAAGVRPALAALLALACRMTPAGSPVPVEGAAAGLTGAWEGDYSVDGDQGHGTIVFTLAPRADTARGQVEMTFAPALRVYAESPEQCDLPRRPCTTMDIAVVRMSGSRVRGTLAPYWHPACDCRAVSVFEGELEGDRIAGSFVTRRESGGAVLSKGSWQVRRRPE